MALKHGTDGLACEISWAICSIFADIHINIDYRTWSRPMRAAPAGNPVHRPVEKGVNLDTSAPMTGSDVGHAGQGTSDARPPSLFLAAAILVHNARVLIVQRSTTESFLPGVWGVPCGKLDPGELPEQAAVRELLEETGLTGKIVRQVGRSEFTSTWNDVQIRNLQTNFLMCLRGDPGPVRLPLPDQRAEWVAFDSISDFPDLDAYNRDVISQALGTHSVSG
jgi:8-oxo-dGTP diphosphatase